jgi:hypothetical protein
MRHHPADLGQVEVAVFPMLPIVPLPSVSAISIR